MLETIKKLQEGIDATTLKQLLFKSFEKVRGRENDPEVCMLML